MDKIIKISSLRKSEPILIFIKIKTNVRPINNFLKKWNIVVYKKI